VLGLQPSVDLKGFVKLCKNGVRLLTGFDKALAAVEREVGLLLRVVEGINKLISKSETGVVMNTLNLA
jgi:hypothetical protein